MGFEDSQYSTYEPVPRGVHEFQLDSVEKKFNETYKQFQFVWSFVATTLKNAAGYPVKLTHYTSIDYGSVSAKATLKNVTKTLDGILGIRLTQAQWELLKRTLTNRLVHQNFLIYVEIELKENGDPKNVIKSIYRAPGSEFPVNEWLTGAPAQSYQQPQYQQPAPTQQYQQPQGYAQQPAPQQYQQPVQQPVHQPQFQQAPPQQPQQFGQAPAPLDAAPPVHQPQQQFGAPQQQAPAGFGTPPPMQSAPPQGSFGTPPAQGFGDQQPTAAAAFGNAAQNGHMQPSGVIAPDNPFA